MNNFRKDFIAKKGSCFKMEERSPLGKVEGDDTPKGVIEQEVKFKRGKAKGNTKMSLKTEYDSEGNVIGHDDTRYRRKGGKKWSSSGGTLIQNYDEE